MFDIRKIQEHIIYEAVKDESNEEIARAAALGNKLIEGKHEVSIKS